MKKTSLQIGDGKNENRIDIDKLKQGGYHGKNIKPNIK